MKNKNHGKSVKTRLLNLMNETGYKYMYLLARYFNERLLYRVSVSQYKDNFLLKGVTTRSIILITIVCLKRTAFKRCFNPNRSLENFAFFLHEKIFNDRFGFNAEALKDFGGYG